MNEIKDAATVLLIRKDGLKSSLLMGRRGSKAAFMPSKFVFPGGAWDPIDNEIQASQPLSKRQTGLLSLEADPSMSYSLGITAIRELWEETGLRLSIKCCPLKHPKSWDGFCMESQGPNPSALQFFFRAVTPPGRLRRFDTRFFFCDASHIYDNLDDFSRASGELSELQWVDIDYFHTFELPKITKIVVEYFKEAILSNFNYADVPFYSGEYGELTAKRLKF